MITTEPTNVIELQCVVVADGGWFLTDMNGPRWSQKENIETARRFSLASAVHFVKSLGRGLHLLNVRVEPAI